MPSADELRALLARVENATGPDREIDKALFAVFDPERANRMTYVQYEGYAPMWTAPAYTASLDAALALVERVLPNAYHETSGPRRYLEIPAPVPNRYRAEIRFGEALNGRTSAGWAATLPHAILAALLRARLATLTEPSHD
jgi:hypothetical protein